MRLSDLQTGESAVVVKVLGHGGFRKRIVEMGFIKGQLVQALLNAPLHDPVKYKIMGYEVSLRRDEAAQIEVVSQEEAKALAKTELKEELGSKIASSDEPDPQAQTERRMKDEAARKRRVINVALVGNPNCGKTSLFNVASGAHERVGNYSGVTVDAKEGHATFEGYEFRIVDLPGTYSLSAYSPEELYVRKQIIDHTPDVVINVIDSSNLERNLYLTTQLIDMNLLMVCALNMFDEFEERGDKLDYNKLGQLLGVPMVPTVFRTGKGVDMLFHIIINMYEGVDFIQKDGKIQPEVASEIQQWHKEYDKDLPKDHEEDFASGDKPRNNVYRHINVNHGRILEDGIARVNEEIQKDQQISYKYSTRYLAIKMLENDSDAREVVAALPNADAINKVCSAEEKRIKDEVGEDSETAMMDAKYGFIHGALEESGYKMGNNSDAYKTTELLDRIITNKYVGFPIFFLLLYLMFQVTFTVGQYPMDWIDAGVAALGEWVNNTMPEGPLKAMIVDGIIGGVGAVIVFLPQILILYFFISFMEDTGYMARAAFIMDKLMHKMGLHGKSFIPLIMGFGCNVPAIMATRTIESRRSRLITMLILPMMSCSARLPIYIMITGIFFAAKYQSLVMISLYVLGVVMAVISSRIFSRWLVKGEDTPFVMELPPYRIPTAKATFRHTWEKGKEYLKKMGGVILVASIVVWALGYYPHNDKLTKQEQQEQSYMGRLGKAVEPVFRPQGFDWKLDIGLLAGVGAKEIVAATMGVIYNNDDTVAEGGEDSASKYQILREEMAADGITPLVALSYLTFVLLYFPCIATIAAIKNESGSWKWAVFSMVYTTGVAWVVSFAVYRIGLLFV